MCPHGEDPASPASVNKKPIFAPLIYYSRMSAHTQQHTDVEWMCMRLLINFTWAEPTRTIHHRGRFSSCDLGTSRTCHWERGQLKRDLTLERLMRELAAGEWRQVDGRRRRSRGRWSRAERVNNRPSSLVKWFVSVKVGGGRGEY